MVISDVVEYKQKIMAKLISIPDVYTLIHNTQITQPSQMINKNIFPYMKIPGTTLTVKNYICFDFSTSLSRTNKLFKDATINVGVISQETDISTGWGNRNDVLAGVIIDAFIWSDFLGFELELVSDKESVFENEYYARTLTFKNLSPNSIKNRVAAND